MRKFKMMMLAAAVAAPALTVAMAVPAQAQVSAVAVVDPEAAMNNSNAWKAAATQLQTAYKPQLDQAEARRTAIQAELQPMVTAFDTARRAPNANEAALRTQAEAIQRKEQAGNAEIQQITMPFARARAYAIEQLQGQLRGAIDAAAKRKNASLVVLPSDVVYMLPAADITAEVTIDLNRLIPAVSITPPANWQPGAQQQQGVAPAAAPPAARPQTQPQGR